MGAPWTPGPWEVGQHPAMTTGWIIRPVLFGSQAYALPQHEGGHIVIRNEANARMIAAAPDLAEACRMLVESYDAETGAYALGRLYEARDAARLALSKARGETE